MTGALTARRLATVIAGGASAAAVAAAVALACGSGAVDWSQVWTPGTYDAAIVWSGRLPRVLAGLVLGGGLAMVGVAFQAMLRNPLADPYILGVSGGAAMGGTLALAIVPAGLFVRLPVVQAFAFGGGLTATFLLWRVARGRNGASPLVILLGGVVFNALAGAFVMCVQTVVVARKAQEIVFWLMGSLDLSSTPIAALMVAGGVVAIGVSALLIRARALDALALGDDGARSAGIDVERLRRALLVASCLVIGAAVSIGGMIGFVGLVVPHGLRLVLGPDHRVLLPAAAFGGGAFLVICDAVSRSLFSVIGTDLPVGVLTAAIGSPLFLYLLWRERDRLWATTG